jgi:SAM-dependent methyltransferase
MRPVAWSAADGIDALLIRSGTVYLTDGLRSLEELRSRSVDFVWSHAVLEHVLKRDFLPTMRELRRVLRDDGLVSHTVDLRDHLSDGLNNLRFPEKIWESKLMRSSGFYTNRIGMSEMLRLFLQAGFEPEIVGISRWPRPPIKRQLLAASFRELPEADLCVSGFDVVLRPNGRY